MVCLDRLSLFITHPSSNCFHSLVCLHWESRSYHDRKIQSYHHLSSFNKLSIQQERTLTHNTWECELFCMLKIVSIACIIWIVHSFNIDVTIEYMNFHHLSVPWWGTRKDDHHNRRWEPSIVGRTFSQENFNFILSECYITTFHDLDSEYDHSRWLKNFERPVHEIVDLLD